MFNERDKRLRKILSPSLRSVADQRPQQQAKAQPSVGVPYYLQNPGQTRGFSRVPEATLLKNSLDAQRAVKENQAPRGLLNNIRSFLPGAVGETAKNVAVGAARMPFVSGARLATTVSGQNLDTSKIGGKTGSVARFVLGNGKIGTLSDEGRELASLPNTLRGKEGLSGDNPLFPLLGLASIGTDLLTGGSKSGVKNAAKGLKTADKAATFKFLAKEVPGASPQAIARASQIIGSTSDVGKIEKTIDALVKSNKPVSPVQAKREFQFRENKSQMVFPGMGTDESIQVLNKQRGKTKAIAMPATTSELESAIRRTPGGAVKPIVRGTEKASKALQLDITKAFKKGETKNVLLAGLNTPVRFVERTFGQKSPVTKAIKEDLLQFTAKQNNELDAWRRSAKSGIEDTFVKKLGIKPDSDLDDALFFYIDGGKDISVLDQVAKKYGDKGVSVVVEAAEKAAELYDTWLTDGNRALAESGQPLIPKRQNYITHITESKEFEGLNDVLNFSTSAGEFNVTRTGKNFAFGKKRKGAKNIKTSAIAALDLYSQGIGQQMFHSASVARSNNLVKTLESVADELPRARAEIEPVINYFKRHNRILAGEVAQVAPIVKAIQRNTGLNMIAFNLVSPFTNLIPSTQAFANTNKKAALRGLSESLFIGDDAAASVVDGVRSTYLTNRFADNSPLVKTKVQKVNDAGYKLFQSIDKRVGHGIVAGKYYEGVQAGLSKADAMKQADEFAARVMADRSIGQNALTFQEGGYKQLLNQFQTEIVNQIEFYKYDVPKRYATSKIDLANRTAQMMVYGFLFNEMFEMATGRRPAIDPIGAATQLLQDIDNEEIDNGQAVKNLFGTVGEALPYSNLLAGGRFESPITAGIPFADGQSSLTDTLGKLLTPEDAGDGARELLGQAVKVPLFLNPIGGGAQVKKTFGALNTIADGGQVNSQGETKFTVDSPTEQFQTLIGGSFATPDAQQYIREGFNPQGSTTKSEKPISSGSGQDSLSAFISETDNKAKVTDGYTERQKQIAKLSVAEQSEAMSRGIISQEEIDNVRAIERVADYQSGSLNEKDVPKDISQEAYKTLQKYNRLSDEGRLKYLYNNAPDDVAKLAADNSNKSRPEGFPELQANNRLGMAYAIFEKKYKNALAESNPVAVKDAKREFWKSAYLSQRTQREENLWSSVSSADDVDTYLTGAELSKEEVDNLVELDRLLYSSGISGSRKFSNTWRENNGYDKIYTGDKTGSSGSSGSGSRSGRGGSSSSASLAIQSIKIPKLTKFGSSAPKMPTFKTTATRKAEDRLQFKRPSQTGNAQKIKLEL